MSSNVDLHTMFVTVHTIMCKTIYMLQNVAYRREHLVHSKFTSFIGDLTALTLQVAMFDVLYRRQIHLHHHAAVTERANILINKTV